MERDTSGQGWLTVLLIGLLLAALGVGGLALTWTYGLHAYQRERVRAAIGA